MPHCHGWRFSERRVMESKPWLRPKQAKITPDQRDKIRSEALRLGANLTTIAAKYGLHKSTVFNIRDGLGSYSNY